MSKRVAFAVVLLCTGCHRDLDTGGCPDDPTACTDAASADAHDDSNADETQPMPDTCACTPGAVIDVTTPCDAALEKRTKTCKTDCTWGDEVCALPRGWTKIANAPEILRGRFEPSAVWTGGELIVFGGVTIPEVFEGTNSGAIYSLYKDSWAELPSTTAAKRRGHSAVWTGRVMVVWGGTTGLSTYYNDGFQYDPVVRAWEAFDASPLAARAQHAAVYVTSLRKLFIWGGTGGSGAFADGAVYDFDSATWSTLPSSPLSARVPAAAFWTGTELAIWGGTGASGPLTDGALYNPATTTWRPVTSAPLTARNAPRVSQTGPNELSFFGGEGDPIPFDGARLNLTSGSWAVFPVPSPSLLSARVSFQSWFDGDRFYVWSGSVEVSGAPKFVSGGAFLDVKAGTWATLPFKDLLAPRVAAISAWTGKGALIVGGMGAPGMGAPEPLVDGAIYVP